MSLRVLAHNIERAALEEMRVRAAYARMMAEWGRALRDCRSAHARC